MTLYEKIKSMTLDQMTEWYVENILFDTEYCYDWCNKKCKKWKKCYEDAKETLESEVNE